MSSGLIGFLSFFSFFFFFLCWKDSAGPIVFYWPNTLRPETLPWLSQKNQDPLVAACLKSALSSYYSLPYPGLSHLGLQGDLVVTRLHPHCWASGKHRPKLSSLSGPGRQARRGLDGCWVSQCLVSINITVFETKEARNHLVSDEPILKVNCFPWLWREIWLKKKKKKQHCLVPEKNGSLWKKENDTFFSILFSFLHYMVHFWKDSRWDSYIH